MWMDGWVSSTVLDVWRSPNDKIGSREYRRLNMDNPEKTDNIGYTKRRKTKEKHSTIKYVCVGHYYTQTFDKYCYSNSGRFVSSKNNEDDTEKVFISEYMSIF